MFHKLMKVDNVSQADTIWQAATCHFARRQHLTVQGVNDWLDKVQTVFNYVLVLFIAQLTAKVTSEPNADHKFTSKVWFAGPVHVTLWVKRVEKEWSWMNKDTQPSTANRLPGGASEPCNAVWNQLQAGCGSQHSGTFISEIRRWGGGIWLERCARTPFYG